MQKISLSKPIISQEAQDSVVNVLNSGWLTQGPLVAQFEASFKAYTGNSYALAVNSATSGLHIALLSLGVGPGDEVIVPSFTWVATANAVEMCGARPIFVDIDLSTLNANTDEILSKITKDTKAIVIVHLFGKPFDVNKLKAKLPRPIYIVEDAACAAGASMHKDLCGTLGDVGVYSFHPRKSITTGEGGMVVTNHPHLYKMMNMLRNHGQDTSYREDSPAFMFDCPIVGFNYRMTDFQAALGLEQFKTIDRLIDYRNSLASLYHKNLGGFPNFTLPIQEETERHSWQSYVILVSDSLVRDELMKQLARFNIETRPGTHAVHTLGYYKNRYHIKPEGFSNTYSAFLKSIALPLHNHMTPKDINYVSEKVIELTHVKK